MREEDHLLAIPMQALGLTSLRRSRAKRRSEGVPLARSLLGTYDLLILDEPTAAMDRASTLSAERFLEFYGI